MISSKEKRVNKSHFSGGNRLSLKKRYRLNSTEGSQGVILTTSLMGTSKKGISEFINYLQKSEMIPEELLGFQSSNELTNEPIDVEAAIAKEIEDIKHKQNRFTMMEDVAKNVSFIKFNERSDDPNKVCKLFYKAALEGDVLPFRFIARLIPITQTCKPFMDDIKRIITPLISKEFPLSKIAMKSDDKEISISSNDIPPNDDSQIPLKVHDVHSKNNDEKKSTVLTSSNVSATSDHTPVQSISDKQSNCPSSPITPNIISEIDTPNTLVTDLPKSYKVSWCCSLTNRNMTAISKQAIYDFLTELIGDEHYYVDLTNPAKAIIVEITPVFCGINVIENFANYSQFSLIKMNKKSSNS